MIDPGSEISAEKELRLAFGRMLGFAFAAFFLLLGGGIAAILTAAMFFRFLYSS